MGKLQVNGAIQASGGIYAGNGIVTIGTNGSISSNLATEGGWARGWTFKNNNTTLGVIGMCGNTSKMNYFYIGTDYEAENCWMRVTPAGVVTAKTFSGALDGNASTATTLSATLAINKGGTGATTRKGAMGNLAFFSAPTSDEEDTSGAFWEAAGFGLTYLGSSSPVTKPCDYFWVQNIHAGTYNLIRQLGFNGNGKQIYTRAGSGNGTMGDWYTLLSTAATVTVAQGGTGITSNPSMLVNLASTTADTVFKASPRPGVTGTLKVANGGTGITSNPSMLVNLGSTTADTVFEASPRPGITGTLGVAHGGTGATTTKGAVYNILGSNITESDSDTKDVSQFVFKLTSPSATNGVLYYRTASDVWTNYFQGKADGRFLKLSGGTVTGALTTSGSVLFTSTVQVKNSAQYPAIGFYPTSASRAMGCIQNSLTLKDGAIVGNQMQLVQWSYTAGTTTGLAKYELYSLPNVTAGKTSNTTYWILTSKNPKSNSYYTLQDMNSSTSAIADTTQLVFKYADPSEANGSVYYRTADYLWTYIYGKGDNRYLKLAGGTMTGTITSQHITPKTSNAYNLGAAAAPWYQIVTRRLYLFDGTNEDVNYGRFIITTQGTTSVQGVASLYVGNANGAKTAGGAYGQVIIFGEGAGYATLRATASATKNSTHYLPTTGGTLLNTATYSSYALPLAGGNMTGGINFTTSNMYYSLSDHTGGAIRLNNGDIGGVNAMWFKDACGVGEGLHFYVSSTTVDTVRANNGVLYFDKTYNTTTSKAAASYTVLHSGNYSSYAVPKAGGTMTGDLTVTNASSTATTSRSVYVATANGTVALHVATGRGIYDSTSSSWMVYAKKDDTKTTRIPNKVVLENSYGTIDQRNKVANPVAGQVFFVTG